jgi:hypothetical protein
MTWVLNTSSTVTVSGSPVTIYSTTPTADGHQIVQYSASSGANVRGGAIHLTWSRAAGRVEWFDQSADSVGSTSALTFSAVMSGGTVRVSATSSSGTWAVNTIAICYERSN